MARGKSVCPSSFPDADVLSGVNARRIRTLSLQSHRKLLYTEWRVYQVHLVLTSSNSSAYMRPSSAVCESQLSVSSLLVIVAACTHCHA